MDIQEIARLILEQVETSTDETEALELVKATVWDSFKVFLNTSYQMRKYQQSYFKHRDKNSLNLSIKLEKELDLMIEFLLEQKQNPKIPMR